MTINTTNALSAPVNYTANGPTYANSNAVAPGSNIISLPAATLVTGANFDNIGANVVAYRNLSLDENVIAGRYTTPNTNTNQIPVGSSNVNSLSPLVTGATSNVVSPLVTGATSNGDTTDLSQLLSNFSGSSMSYGSDTNYSTGNASNSITFNPEPLPVVSEPEKPRLITGEEDAQGYLSNNAIREVIESQFNDDGTLSLFTSVQSITLKTGEVISNETSSEFPSLVPLLRDSEVIEVTNIGGDIIISESELYDWDLVDTVNIFYSANGIEGVINVSVQDYSASQDLDFVYTPEESTPFEGYDPLNNWQPAVRKEINPGGAAADYLGDELFQNQPSGRLMGLNNRASDSTFGDIEFGAFVMGEAGSFDDGSIAGDQYVGTLVTDMEEGFRWSGNFNRGQRSPLDGLGAMDGALVDTQTGDVLAVYENVMDL